MDNIVGVGEAAFSAILLAIAAGVSSHICFGYGTRKWTEAFIGLLCGLLLSVQLYHLVVAVQHVPSYPYQFNDDLVRVDCHESSKGGKRPKGSTGYQFKNPCFCLGEAKCYDTSTGDVITSDLPCPADGSAFCSINISGIVKNVDLFIPDDRGCTAAQPAQCTKDNPCEPCGRQTLADWGYQRCRSCSTEFSRSCNFLPDIGPYCLATKGSKEVVPCTECCTDAEPFFANGTCY